MFKLILLLLSLSLSVCGINGSFSSSNYLVNSSFEGTGHKSIAPIGPLTKSTRPTYTKSELEKLNEKRKHCREVHTPPAACGLRNSDDFYGRWYVSSIPGLAQGSPICEKVDFYRDTTQKNFFKKLQIYLRNGTWYTQYQNGTLISAGKVLLELDLDTNHNPSKPRVLLNYTMIDFDPKHYITAFFCMRGKPVVPVLTRSKKPSMKVWERIFQGVLKAGASLSWMDLFCRPSVATNIARYDISPTKPRQMPKLQYRSSVSKGEIIF